MRYVGLQVMELAMIQDHEPSDELLHAGAAFQDVVLQLSRLTELRVRDVNVRFWEDFFQFKETDLTNWRKLRYICPLLIRHWIIRYI